MASTVSAAALTVIISEEITLHGYEQGSRNTLTITNISEIQKRIVTVPTSEKEIVAISTTTVGAGMFIEDDVRYMRITNLDDTNHITLTFKDENDSEFAVLIDKGESFIYSSDLSNGVKNTMDAGTTALSVSLGCLVNVTAVADTAACDCEIFVASV